MGHVTTVVWAFNFAGVLEPEFAAPVGKVLRIVGREMDSSRLGSHKMPRFREGSRSGADEPYVELDGGDMMVIYKPPGWEVDTADVGDARWLSQYLQSLCAWPPGSIVLDHSHEYGFLHRLDTPSSGLILTAKTYEAYYHLQFQLSVGALVRDYVVLCHGLIAPERREINARVHHWSFEGNQAPSTIGQKGKPSRTYLKVLAHLVRQQQNFSLVAMRICTGRRHQIRAHAAHIGHPTVCDSKYTAPAVFSADHEWCTRNFIHRYRLAFLDFEGRTLEAVAPLPTDLILALSCLEPKDPVSAEVLEMWLCNQALCDWASYNPLPETGFQPS